MTDSIPQRQPDLFARQGDLFHPAPQPLPAADVERIRQKLLATLALVRGAEFQPWADLTRMTLEEISFRSMCDHLPPAEAAAMRAAFETEMDRIYANEDARWEAEEQARRPGADPPRIDSPRPIP